MPSNQDYRRSGDMISAFIEAEAEADGSFEDACSACGIYGVLIGAESIPRDPAPTKKWGFKLCDIDGYDLLDGRGSDRDDEAPQLIRIPNGGAPVYGQIVLRVAGNDVPGAKINFKIHARAFS